jgi:hypothetical protein
LPIWIGSIHLIAVYFARKLNYETYHQTGTGRYLDFHFVCLPVAGVCNACAFRDICGDHSHPAATHTHPAAHGHA